MNVRLRNYLAYIYVFSLWKKIRHQLLYLVLFCIWCFCPCTCYLRKYCRFQKVRDFYFPFIYNWTVSMKYLFFLWEEFFYCILRHMNFVNGINFFFFFVISICRIILLSWSIFFFFKGKLKRNQFFSNMWGIVSFFF